MNVSSISIPGGHPSITPPMALPCDSPKDVNVKNLPMVFDITFFGKNIIQKENAMEKFKDFPIA
jgi:hypothetical protein